MIIISQRREMAPSGSNISPVSQTVRPPVGLFGSSWVRCAGRACVCMWGAGLQALNLGPN